MNPTKCWILDLAKNHAIPNSMKRGLLSCWTQAAICILQDFPPLQISFVGKALEQALQGKILTYVLCFFFEKMTYVLYSYVITN